jgi:FKBP-type peptidyl-prolyl cis-trans isomerase
LRLFLFIFLISFFGCKKNQNGYEEVEEGAEFKILKLGNHEITATPDDVITVQLTYHCLDTNVNEIELMNLINGVKVIRYIDNPFNNILFGMGEGDSALIKLNVNTFLNSFVISQLNYFPDSMLISAYIYNVTQKDTFQRQLTSFQKWMEEEKIFENQQIEKFIAKNEFAIEPDANGLYFNLLQEGFGNPPQVGNKILVHYKGYLLNGKEFDNTYIKGEPMDVIFGLSGQMIKGFELATAKMNQGAKAQILLPSALAFGDRGSSTGIIAPNTPLWYEIELVKIY